MTAQVPPVGPVLTADCASRPNSRQWDRDAFEVLQLVDGDHTPDRRATKGVHDHRHPWRSPLGTSAASKRR
jgi:hypothetical protein